MTIGLVGDLPIEVIILAELRHVKYEQLALLEDVLQPATQRYVPLLDHTRHFDIRRGAFPDCIVQRKLHFFVQIEVLIAEVALVHSQI